MASVGTKMALVNQELLQYLKNVRKESKLTQSPVFKKVKSLDDEIVDILDAKNIPERKKARLYAYKATEFLKYLDRIGENVPKGLSVELEKKKLEEEEEIPKPKKRRRLRPLSSSTSSPPPISSADDDSNVFSSADEGLTEKTPPSSPEIGVKLLAQTFTKPKKEKTIALIKHIRSHKANHLISVDHNTNRLKINGIPIHKSNIDRILDHVTLVKPRLGEPIPKGTWEFLDTLSKTGVDTRHIANEDYKDYIREQAKQMKKKKILLGTGGLKWTGVWHRYKMQKK